MEIGKTSKVHSSIITQSSSIENADTTPTKKPLQYVHPDTGPLNPSSEIQEISRKAKTDVVKESTTENVKVPEKISFKQMMSKLFTKQNILMGGAVVMLIALVTLLPIISPAAAAAIFAIIKFIASVATSVVLIGGGIAGIALLIKKYGHLVAGHKSREPGDDGKNLDQDTKRLERHAKLNNKARVEHIHNIHHSDNNTVK